MKKSTEKNTKSTKTSNPKNCGKNGSGNGGCSETKNCR